MTSPLIARLTTVALPSDSFISLCLGLVDCLGI
jgi:hypothetical protein